MTVATAVLISTPTQTSDGVACLGALPRTTGAEHDSSSTARTEHETWLQVGEKPALSRRVLRLAGGDHANSDRFE